MKNCIALYQPRISLSRRYGSSSNNLARRRIEKCAWKCLTLVRYTRLQLGHIYGRVLSGSACSYSFMSGKCQTGFSWWTFPELKSDVSTWLDIRDPGNSKNLRPSVDSGIYSTLSRRRRRDAIMRNEEGSNEAGSLEERAEILREYQENNSTGWKI